MATKLKLKKSSVAGRIPLVGDLDYGELAINYADGKLYYKNSSNQIKAFIDSATVQSLVGSGGGGATVDSATIINIVDSAYVSARLVLDNAANVSLSRNYATADSGQTSFTGLDYQSNNLLVFLNGILLDPTTDYTATNGTSLTLTTAADSGDELHLVDHTSLFNLENAIIDSADVTNIVNTAYIQARQDKAYSSLTGAPTTVSSFTNDAGYSTFDSGNIQAIINTAYIQARQDFSYASLTGTPVVFDSDAVKGIIDTTYIQGIVNTAYVQARQDFAYASLTGAPNVLDSADVISLISANASGGTDSATVLSLSLDSAEVTSLIDSAYIQARQSSGGGASDATVTSVANTAYGFHVDLSSATNTSNYIFSFGGAATSNGIFWSTDGTYLFECDGNTDIVRGVPVPTPFDITSVTSPSDTNNQIDTSAQNSYIEDIWFSPDGLRLVIISSSGSTNHAVYSYTMTTAWDLNTASYDNKTINVNGTAGGGVSGIHLSPDGRKMFLNSASTDKVHEYALSTAYDISTATESQTLDISSQTGGSTGIRFNNQGTQMFISDNGNGATVYQYKLTLPFNISTAVYEKSHTNVSGGNYNKGLALSADGSYLHVCQGGRVYEITLSSNASYSTPVVGKDVLSYDSNLQDFVSTFTLPSSDGSTNQVLTTDGSGNLSFANASGGGGLDSAATINLIDSAYVQARQSTGGNISQFTNDAGYTDFDSASLPGALKTFAANRIQISTNNGYFGVGTASGSAGMAIKNNSGQPFFYGAKYYPANGTTDLELEANTGGKINVNGFRIYNVGTPTDNTDAATKLYVDNNTFSGNYNDLTNKPSLFDGAYSSLTGAPNVLDSADVTNIIGQGVAPTDSATFAGMTISNNLTVNGNLHVHGTETVLNTTTLEIEKPMVHLAQQLATLNVGTINGQYAGFDSDFGTKSTSDITEGTNLYYTKARVDSDTAALIDSNYIQLRQASASVDSATILAVATEPKTYTSSTTYTVTVATKTSGNVNYNTGSSSAYFLDGIETPFIEFVSGQTYVFDQADNSNSGHAIRFYYDLDKTTEYSTGVTVAGTAGSSGASTTIVVDDDTPSRLYYQCENHDKMGWAVGVDNHNLTGLTTDDLTEGTTNRYFSNSLAQAAFTGGTGVTISSGSISIGQPVGTSDNVTFGNVTVGGNLSVSGSSATLNVASLYVDDNIVTLNNDASGTPSDNVGIEVNRGTSANVSLIWDEDSDNWQVTTDGTNFYKILTSADSISADDATSLNGQAASYYLDYTNFTNTPSSITDFSISDGNAGQVLTTDGSGNFSFTTVSGGGGGGVVDM